MVSKLMSRNCFGIIDVHIVLALSNSLSDIRAALSAPTEEPDTATRFFSSCISRRAFHTPSWYAPFAPPPARVSAHFSSDGKSSFVITGALMSSSVIFLPEETGAAGDADGMPVFFDTASELYAILSGCISP